MISVPPLLFLFLIQFLLMFAVLSAVLFLRSRKIRAQGSLSEGEASRLKDEVEAMAHKSAELAKWEEMFLSMQAQFSQSKDENTTLKESIERLIPEAERSKEFERLMAAAEQNKRELDSSIGTLKQENIQLGEEVQSLKTQVDTLTQQLSQSVPGEKYEALSSQKKSLELKMAKINKQLEEEHSILEQLKNNYSWLEKEYNALYDNIQEATPGSEPTPTTHP